MDRKLFYGGSPKKYPLRSRSNSTGSSTVQALQTPTRSKPNIRSKSRTPGRPKSMTTKQRSGLKAFINEQKPQYLSRYSFLTTDQINGKLTKMWMKMTKEEQSNYSTLSSLNCTPRRRQSLPWTPIKSPSLARSARSNKFFLDKEVINQKNAKEAGHGDEAGVTSLSVAVPGRPGASKRTDDDSGNDTDDSALAWPLDVQTNNFINDQPGGKGDVPVFQPNKNSRIYQVSDHHTLLKTKTPEVLGQTNSMASSILIRKGQERKKDSLCVSFSKCDNIRNFADVSNENIDVDEVVNSDKTDTSAESVSNNKFTSALEKKSTKADTANANKIYEFFDESPVKVPFKSPRRKSLTFINDPMDSDKVASKKKVAKQSISSSPVQANRSKARNTQTKSEKMKPSPTGSKSEPKIKKRKKSPPKDTNNTPNVSPMKDDQQETPKKVISPVLKCSAQEDIKLIKSDKKLKGKGKKSLNADFNITQQPRKQQSILQYFNKNSEASKVETKSISVVIARTVDHAECEIEEVKSLEKGKTKYSGKIDMKLDKEAKSEDPFGFQTPQVPENRIGEMIKNSNNSKENMQQDSKVPLVTPQMPQNLLSDVLKEVSKSPKKRRRTNSGGVIVDLEEDGEVEGIIGDRKSRKNLESDMEESQKSDASSINSKIVKKPARKVPSKSGTAKNQVKVPAFKGRKKMEKIDMKAILEAESESIGSEFESECDTVSPERLSSVKELNERNNVFPSKQSGSSDINNNSYSWESSGNTNGYESSDDDSSVMMHREDNVQYYDEISQNCESIVIEAAHKPQNTQHDVNDSFELAPETTDLALIKNDGNMEQNKISDKVKRGDKSKKKTQKDTVVLKDQADGDQQDNLFDNNPTTELKKSEENDRKKVSKTDKGKVEKPELENKKIQEKDDKIFAKQDPLSDTQMSDDIWNFNTPDDVIPSAQVMDPFKDLEVECSSPEIFLTQQSKKSSRVVDRALQMLRQIGTPAATVMSTDDSCQSNFSFGNDNIDSDPIFSSAQDMEIGADSDTGSPNALTFRKISTTPRKTYLKKDIEPRGVDFDKVVTESKPKDFLGSMFDSLTPEDEKVKDSPRRWMKSGAKESESNFDEMFQSSEIFF